jgi:plastocyanin
MKSTNRLLQFIYVFGLMAGFCCGPRALATTNNVDVVGFAFSPPTATINVNDTVQWTFQDASQHTSTSDTGLWNSPALNNNATFSFQFTATGTFAYHCAIHTSMLGSVVVSAANNPPTVSISSPSSGSVFAAPWNAVFKVAASDPDPGGSVSKVQFFTNNVSAGTVSNSPFNLSVGNLAAGSYTLKAVATDNLGATSATTNTFTVVTPVPVTLTNPALLSPTQFKFTYSANPGLRYVVQRSFTISNLVSLVTNTAASSSVTFTDSAAGPDQGYYRVGRLPNP